MVPDVEVHAAHDQVAGERAAEGVDGGVFNPAGSDEVAELERPGRKKPRQETGPSLDMHGQTGRRPYRDPVDFGDGETFLKADQNPTFQNFREVFPATLQGFAGGPDPF